MEKKPIKNYEDPFICDECQPYGRCMGFNIEKAKIEVEPEALDKEDLEEIKEKIEEALVEVY